jgi:hypothetical protein
MYTIAEATDRSEPGKVKHTADPGGYGRKDDEDEEGNKVKDTSTEKRGKGRPKKATATSGEDKKYDFSAFGVKSGKDVKLPKYDKKKTTKHSIKEYIDQLESAINDPEHVEYLKRQADISRSTGLTVGDRVTIKNRPGFEGEIVHDWGGGDFTISGGGGGMSQSKNHRANARLIQKIQGVAEEGVTIKPMPGASQIIGADGKSMGTADAATANTIKQASEKGTLNLGGGDEQMNEKSNTPASDKGKYAGKSKSELIKAYNHLTSTGPHEAGSKPHSNMKELATAIRSKGQFGKSQDGKLDELDASTVASYQDKAFDKYMGGDEKRAQGLDRASKKQAGAFGHVPTTKPQNVEEETVEESGLQAWLGKKKYGPGFEKLQDAGRKGASEKTKQNIRAQYSDKEEPMKEEKDLPGNRDRLDIAKPKGKLTKADFAALRAKKSVKESLSFTEMMQEAGTDVNDMMAELQQDIDNFNKTGHCSDKLEAFLKIHGHSKKKLAGESIVDRVGFDTPPEIDKNPMTQNPMTTPAFARKQQSQGMPIKSPGEDKPFGFMRQISAPTKTFESKDMKDVQLESWEKELTSLLNEGITVTSSQGQQGTPDSVSINATDSDAQELLSIVRQAGLGVFGGGDEQAHSGYGAPMSGDEGGSGTEPQMSPSVVGDGDDMMALIKKMSGIQSDPGPATHDHEGHSSDQEDGPKGTLTPDYEDEDKVGDGQGEGEEKTDEGAGVMHFKNQEAKKDGEDSFKLGDKEFPVKEHDDESSGIIPALAGGALGYAVGSGALDGVGSAIGSAIGLEEKETVNSNGKYQKVTGGSCNECGMFEARCVCSSDKEQVEEYANDAGNEEFAQLKHMLGQGNDLHREKRSQAVGNPTQVTTETRLFKDTSNLLVDWQKLSGIK